MARVRRKDTPEYVAEVSAGARPIGSQLAIGVGFLTMLLVAMSAVEEPILHQDLHVDRAGEMERPPAREPGLLCSFGGEIVSWMTVEAS